MIGIGVGEILGALICGKVTDWKGTKAGLYVIISMAIPALTVLILINELFEFSALSYVMCLLWGLMDGAENTFSNCVLGFEFDSNLIPFSVQWIVTAVSIFAF